MMIFIFILIYSLLLFNDYFCMAEFSAFLVFSDFSFLGLKI